MNNVIKFFSNLPDYENFLNSTYIQSNNEYIPKFGDIITLARGRLEKLPNNQYYFIEGQCNTKRCNHHSNNHKNSSKLIAYWIVQKIRHRDPEKKFRYELKINIIPNTGDKNDSNKRETANKYESKAFILKEDDYPKNFLNVEKHIAQRRSDGNNEYVDRFNHYLFQPQSQYLRNKIYNDVQENEKYHISDLNTGEYIPNHGITLDMMQLGDNGRSYNKILLPTTFHPKYKLKSFNSLQPNYGIKYPDETFSDMEKITSPAHHLHHHFYIMRNNFPDNSYGLSHPLKDNTGLLQSEQFDVHQFHTSTPTSNQIPIPPNLHFPSDTYQIPVTRPIISSPPILHMHMQPIPMYPILPLGEQIQSKHQYTESTQPFIENLQVPTVHYSDPDPFYHGVNKDTQNHNNNEVSIEKENSSQEKSTQPFNTVTQATQDDSEVSESTRNHNSDEIDEQLSPPDSDNQSSLKQTETDNSHVTQTSAISGFLAAPRSSIEPSTTPSNIEATITEPSTENTYQQEDFGEYFQTTKTTIIPTTVQIPNIRRYYRPTTEQPVLKWRPKRPMKITLPNTSFTTSNSLKPTSDTNSKFEFEKVPINTTEKIITVTPSKTDAEHDEDEISTKQSVSTSISIKVGTETQEHPFIPTLSLPNVELFKADLENVKTNSSLIKLYKASDFKTPLNKNEKNEENELTKTIVQHVKNLT